MDLDVGKPEIIVNIDRDKARRFGISTMEIASTIRTALFGKEISDFKVGEEEYPIQLRLKDENRYNMASLLDLRISFREEGKLIQIPVSAVADITYSTTYGAVNRKDMNRVITLYSNILEGYNGTQINTRLKHLLKDFDLPEDAFLPLNIGTECVVQGGKTRLKPVLLTAITTILGLLPLATGMNINFNTLLNDFNPQFYFGGDMVAFWGPISWTIIFGLTFSTFLTLVIVPVMYRISIIIQKKLIYLFNPETRKQIPV